MVFLACVAVGTIRAMAKFWRRYYRAAAAKKAAASSIIFHRADTTKAMDLKIKRATKKSMARFPFNINYVYMRYYFALEFYCSGLCMGKSFRVD